jgi:hypothetical protein
MILQKSLYFFMKSAIWDKAKIGNSFINSYLRSWTWSCSKKIKNDCNTHTINLVLLKRSLNDFHPKKYAHSIFDFMTNFISIPMFWAQFCCRFRNKYCRESKLLLPGNSLWSTLFTGRISPDSPTSPVKQNLYLQECPRLMII